MIRLRRCSCKSWLFNMRIHWLATSLMLTRLPSVCGNTNRRKNVFATKSQIGLNTSNARAAGWISVLSSRPNRREKPTKHCGQRGRCVSRRRFFATQHGSESPEHEDQPNLHASPRILKLPLTLALHVSLGHAPAEPVSIASNKAHTSHESNSQEDNGREEASQIYDHKATLVRMIGRRTGGAAL